MDYSFMDYSYMDDEYWKTLEPSMQAKVVDEMFKRDMVSDPGWKALDVSMQTQVKDHYSTGADEYNTALSEEPEEDVEKEYDIIGGVKDFGKLLMNMLKNQVQGAVDAFGYLGKIIKSALTLDWDGVKEGAAGFG